MTIKNQPWARETTSKMTDNNNHPVLIKEKNLPKVIIPDVLIDRITKSKDPDEEGIRICVEQIKELKEMKGIHGIHLMGMDVEG